MKFSLFRSWGFVIVLANSTYAHHPLNLSIAKENVENYYECGQYDKDLNKLIDRAIKHFSKISATDNKAVIFDIDDTMLDDYCNEKHVDFGYIPELFHEWIMSANLTAIPQTKRLYDYLRKRGFHIIIITGRSFEEYNATVKNLKEQGYTGWDQLILRNAQEKKLTAQAYKSARRLQLIKEGYHIIGSVGDQWSDHEGGNAGYVVKLPNFRYVLN